MDALASLLILCLTNDLVTSSSIEREHKKNLQAAARSSRNLSVPECNPPDYPQWGGYGPRQDYYLPGDEIHYYCDVESYIGGPIIRRCEDTGHWSGDTPVCDNPTRFSSTQQTSTDEPSEDNNAGLAVDGVRTTCSSTIAGTESTWTGTLETPGELIRVMLFMPKGELAYEVIAVRANGSELRCGEKRGTKDRYDWEFHNCHGPYNRDMVGLKIKSLSSAPLQICEIYAHVLTVPTCTDPRLLIENGRLQLSRKKALLVCDSGYTRSPQTRIECVRDGVWNRKTLYCLEKQWEVDNNQPAGSSDREPQTNGGSPERERQTIANGHREVKR